MNRARPRFSSGRISMTTMLGFQGQKHAFTESFEKSDYGEKDHWPNKYRDVVLGKGVTMAARQMPFKEGGKIHIKPENRGKFTAWAKKHGLSVGQAASQVMAHKENYSPSVVKQANFAKNARKWNHASGGQILWGAPQSIRHRIIM